MARKVVGPTGSRRRRWLFLCTTMAAIALAVLFIPSAFAVHDTGAFELDGNATTQTSDDWDHVCHQVIGSDCTTSSNTSGATAVSWTADCPVGQSGESCGNLNATIFTGGGSKDPQNISSWAWKDASGGLPDKDNLLHGFAARYSLPSTGQNTGGCPNGVADQSVNCDVLFFGSDRYDNSGDAQQGFWFLQNKIGFGANSVNGGTGFTGVHKNGDVLVISDFSNGGTTATITVYKWDSTCTKGATKPNPGDCGDANLRLLSTSTDAKCSATLAANDSACGIVNPSTTTMPWTFTDKSGTANNGALNGEFYEGGINLSTLGLGGECFASIASETRSSTSTTATLKDFILGRFGSCTAGFATQTSDTELSIGDSAPTDTVTISASGASGTPPAPTGTVSFFLCGPSVTQITSCDPTGKTAFDTEDLANATASGNDYSIDSSAPTITSAGYYCFTATWPGDTNYTDGPYQDDGSNECFHVSPLTPDISTLVSDAGPVVPGTAVSDDAMLSGTATPSNDTQGTITWHAYGPDDATCSTSVYTSVATINGNGTYNSSTDGDGGDFAPNDPGVYRWRAFYAPDSGDVNNAAVSTPCNDTGESFEVQQFNPTLATAQTWTVKDTATITADGGGDLSGTAHFALYDNSTCTGTALYSEDVPVSGASPQDASTTPQEFTSSATTLYWNVSYSSDNGAQTGIDATCIENSSLTIDNGS
jgi:hypothetical protein